MPTPLRCFRCQAYGHKAMTCHSKERCRCCAGEHKAEACPNKDKPTCASCKGMHEAGSKLCPRYIQCKSALKLASTEKIGFKQAFRQVKKVGTVQAAPAAVPDSVDIQVASSSVEEATGAVAEVVAAPVSVQGRGKGNGKSSVYRAGTSAVEPAVVQAIVVGPVAEQVAVDKVAPIQVSAGVQMESGAASVDQSSSSRGVSTEDIMSKFLTIMINILTACNIDNKILDAVVQAARACLSLSSCIGNTVM